MLLGDPLLMDLTQDVPSALLCCAKDPCTAAQTVHNLERAGVSWMLRSAMSFITLS